jgi:hypothetical protein
MALKLTAATSNRRQNRPHNRPCTHAIAMIKGVLEVKPVVVNADDYINRTRILSKMREKIYNLLRDEL